MYTKEEEHLFMAELPAATSTYSPVAHRDIIDPVFHMLETIGYDLDTEVHRNYSHANRAEIMTAVYRIIPIDPAPLPKQVLMFQNSYNKRMVIKFAFGTEISGTTIMSSDIEFRRKHTGSVKSELRDLISEAAEYLSFTHKEILEQQQIMNWVVLGPDTVSRLIGELFISRSVLNSNQVTLVKNEVKTYLRKHKSIGLWKLFTIITASLAQTHASKQIDGYRALYGTVKSKFGLI